MKIWVDADSCPRPVRDIVLRACARTGIEAVFVANKPVSGLADTNARFILCSAGADIADDVIVSEAEPGDLAVTRDIPLAARLVEAGILALNDRGTIYTAENVRERLSIRNFMMELNSQGISPDRMYGYGKKELKAFADGFDKVLAKLLKEPGPPVKKAT
jgi:uncharacterized protein YaiI (UPF0178 family)